MQTELAAQPVAFIGVNELGEESQNDLMPAISDLPWLQDVDADGNGSSDLWAAWGAKYRDILILNDRNEIVDTYNLVANDLGRPADYETLKSKILAVANTGGASGNGWPSGWVYMQWPYLYNPSSGSWNYFSPGENNWHADLATGSWSSLNTTDGWLYFGSSAGYFYNSTTSRWHYYSPDNTQWIVNLSTGDWNPFEAPTP